MSALRRSTAVARGAVLGIALAFLFSAGVVPVVHVAEEGEELREYLSAVAAYETAEEDPLAPQEPLPPEPHVPGGPDDVDCLLCQVVVTPGVPGAEQPVPLDLLSGDSAVPEVSEFAGSSPSLSVNARAPPLI